MQEFVIQPRDVEPWDDQAPQQADDYDPNYRRERWGNNKAKVKKSVAKAKRKMAKLSKRKNRK